MAEFPRWVYRLNPPFETSTTQIQTYNEAVLSIEKVPTIVYPHHTKQ